VSRSRKHSTYFAHSCAESDSWWKSTANRRLRRVVREAMRTTGETTDTRLREVSDEYNSAKDGRSYRTPETILPGWFEKGMRK